MYTFCSSLLPILNKKSAHKAGKKLGINQSLNCSGMFLKISPLMDYDNNDFDDMNINTQIITIPTPITMIIRRTKSIKE